MTFVSWPFAILLLVTLILTPLLRGRGRVLFLLAASYVFYAYWNPWYAFLILTSTAIDYAAALLIASSASARRRKAALWTSVIANLGLLGYFKYTNFGLHIVHAWFGASSTFLPQSLSIILPVGISFYTFQSMAYTIDVYRGRIKAERDFGAFALYVSFFPQLVAGPIERAADLLPQIKRLPSATPIQREEGVRLLLWGFMKKLVFADRLYALAFPMMKEAGSMHAPDLLFATLALFTMLYFDFSAYTDMARGTALLFGVRLTENFHRPMAATSIAEFWRGWHMTLSSWVRDYVFIPLGGGRPRGFWHQTRITLLTMGLVGLWHGANWTYIIWGLQHGAMMVLYQVYYLKIRRRWKKSAIFESAWFAFAGWILTMLLHAVGMAWFFSPDVGQAVDCLSRMIHPSAWRWPVEAATWPGFLLLAGLWAIHAVGAKWFPLHALSNRPPWQRALAYAMIFFIIVFLGVAKSQTFVYFQF